MLTFDLSLAPFVDGGWYWYDVVAGHGDVVVESAEWSAEVPAERARPGTLDIAITTMNRPDFCADLLAQLGGGELDDVLDTVFVMEQGTNKVADGPGFAAAEKALGERLRLIEQGNLGGSGGYARGQLESLRKGTATYTMMMDDDVVAEPDGIVRAVNLRRPRPPPHDRRRPHVQPVLPQPPAQLRRDHPAVPLLVDVAEGRLQRLGLRRAQPPFGPLAPQAPGRRLQRLVHVPGAAPVIDEIGLSLPLFIKWDDSEYGLRARAAGYPTVTFPGAAVWHVPWTDKNDSLDWQAYFHQRNRYIAALLHSGYPRGGGLLKESLAHDLAHLVSMQYSTVELRLQALEDVLAGPQGLHAMLPTRLAEVNAFRRGFTDAQLHRATPTPCRRCAARSRPRKGRDSSEVPGRLAKMVTAGLAPVRHLKNPRALSREFPEAEVRAMDAKWYRLATYDSAVVSMNDGTSAALYRRDPEKYRELVDARSPSTPGTVGSGPSWPVPTAPRSVTSPRRRSGSRPSRPGPTRTPDDRHHHQPHALG